jgi:hypothetical protein
MPRTALVILVLLTMVLAGCAQIDTFISDLTHLVAGNPPNSNQGTAPTTVSALAEIDTATESPPTISPTITKTPTPELTRTPRPTYTPSVTIPPIPAFVRVGPDDIPEGTNPLTGLPAPNPDLLDRRPIAIKISNFPHSVRPQSGLSLADNVYEYYLEDGLTRFVGIYYGKDASKVGPIRSGRLFDEHIARMYNSILVFNSADDQVLDYFLESDLLNRLVLERHCPPLCRDQAVPRPNNLFGNTQQISQYINERGSDNSKPDLSSNYFYALKIYSRQIATQITLRYSYASYARWVFDNGQQGYLRFQGSVDNLGDTSEEFTLLTDALTELPIMADNVVFLMVPHEYYYRSSDTEIFSINLFERGDAYVFRDGEVSLAIWQRTAEDKPLSILDLDGSPFPLKPGITFFQVMSDNSIVTQDETSWDFEFQRPVEE